MTLRMNAVKKTHHSVTGRKTTLICIHKVATCSKRSIFYFHFVTFSSILLIYGKLVFFPNTSAQHEWHSIFAHYATPNCCSRDSGHKHENLRKKIVNLCRNPGVQSMYSFNSQIPIATQIGNLESQMTSDFRE